MQIGAQSISPVRLRRLRQTAGAVVAAAGALVLCGWLFDVTVLKSVLPHLVSMKANAAVCFLLAGLALWWWPKEGNRSGRVIAGCAVLIALIGLLTLAEYVTGLNFGIDELLFRDTWPSPVTAFPGRMGLNTALSLTLNGTALLLARWPGLRGRLSQWCALLAGLVGLIALVGYLFSLTQFLNFASYTNMALHAALCLPVLTFGILLLRPEEGVMRLALNPGLAGVVLRRLLPLTSLMLLALSGLIQRGRAIGL